MGRQAIWQRVVVGVFAALDVVLLLRFRGSIRFPYLMQEVTWWVNALEVMRPILLLSMIASAVGLALARQWGYVVSYVQAPFRYAFVLLSFGFLALLAGGEASYRIAIYVAMVLEVVRLAVTIYMHVKARRGATKSVERPHSAS